MFSQGLSVFLGAYSRLMNNDHFLHVNLAHFPTVKLHIDSNGLSVHEERGKKWSIQMFYFSNQAEAEAQLKTISFCLCCYLGQN